MIFATHSRGVTVPYMGSISPQDLDISDHVIRYRMHAVGETNLAFRLHISPDAARISSVMRTGLLS